MEIIRETHRKSLFQFLIPVIIMLLTLVGILSSLSFENIYFWYMGFALVAGIIVMLFLVSREKVTYILSNGTLTSQIGRYSKLAIDLSRITSIQKIKWSWKDYYLDTLRLGRKNLWADKVEMDTFLPGLGRDYYLITYDSKYERDCMMAIRPSDRFMNYLHETLKLKCI